MTEPDAPNGTQLPAETIDRLITLQERELQHRGQELEVRRTEIEHNANYAQASLNAHLEDRQNERNARDRVAKRNAFLGGAVVFGLIASAVIFAFLNKENLLIELIKVTVIAVGAYKWGQFGQRRNGQT